MHRRARSDGTSRSTGRQRPARRASRRAIDETEVLSVRRLLRRHAGRDLDPAPGTRVRTGAATGAIDRSAKPREYPPARARWQHAHPGLPSPAGPCSPELPGKGSARSVGGCVLRARPAGDARGLRRCLLEEYRHHEVQQHEQGVDRRPHFRACPALPLAVVVLGPAVGQLLAQRCRVHRRRHSASTAMIAETTARRSPCGIFRWRSAPRVALRAAAIYGVNPAAACRSEGHHRAGQELRKWPQSISGTPGSAGGVQNARRRLAPSAPSNTLESRVERRRTGRQRRVNPNARQTPGGEPLLRLGDGSARI